MGKSFCIRSNSILLIGILFIFASPFSAYLFELESKYLIDWNMYGRWGSDICDVKFYAAENGDLKTIDRFKTLGYSTKSEAPQKLRFIDNPTRLAYYTSLMCQALPGTDIRVRARCGSPNGWKEHLIDTEKLCNS